MDVKKPSGAAASIAAAIGEPARARMLYCLMGGLAGTSTELAIVADVSPSTASAHLNRLKAERLVKVAVQGKHRYYSLDGPHVASVLESLSVLAGGNLQPSLPNTPNHLRAARTCYDHIAGTLGVSLHDRFMALKWLSADPKGPDGAYDLTRSGTDAFQVLGIDIRDMRALRRRFAYACLDWSERRPHLGGALGAAILGTALKKKWVTQEREGRALSPTPLGRREMRARFGLQI